MSFSSILAGSLAAAFWTVSAAFAAGAPAPGNAERSKAPEVVATSSVVTTASAPDVSPPAAEVGTPPEAEKLSIESEILPGDDPPHQAAVLGCAHARQAMLSGLDQAPPPPPAEMAIIGQLTDVLHYFLDITVTPSPANITGTNTITVKCLQNGVNSFGIQLHQNFTISSMTVNGIPVTWNRLDVANVNVTLDHTYNADEQFDLAIAYGGTPVSGGFGSVNFTTHSTQPLVFTLSEPYYAYTWWPVKEDNRDKATGEMWITVPNTMKVASNGTLQGTDAPPTVPAGKLRYRWLTNYQAAPYLFCFSATNYNEFSDVWNYTGGSMPMQFFIYPESDNASNRNAWLNTKQMLTTFSGKYGQYPFVNEKYGIYQFGFSGGMEHQTMTGQGTFSESVTAHELAHQWWGDKTTTADWGHIWLNEGFADYSEAIWLEFKPGSTGTAALLSAMSSRRPSSPYGQTVFRANTSSASIIFDQQSVYYKGGWVLHMLRHVFAGTPGGDANFFAMMQAYSNTYAYAAATTEDFQAVAEQYYGGSLEWFFDKWVYFPGAPTYQISSRRLSVGGGQYVELYLNQTQTATYPSIYTMPLDTRVALVAGGPYNTVLWNDARTEHFLIPVPSQAALTNPVTLDPNSCVLRVTTISNVAFVEGPPKVVKVTPNPGSVSPSASVPNIQIVFHKNVNATAGNFAITGQSTGDVPFTFAYDAVTGTATLTPTSPLAGDTYAVSVSAALTDVIANKALDGEVTNPSNPASLPSGDGLPGGAFSVNIEIEGALCVGDLDDSGDVGINDLVSVITNWGATGTPGTVAGDANADGVVDINDLVQVITHWGGCP